MQAHGGDRVRVVGEKIVLLSPISKGWTARVPKQATHSEHPGTAVLWDEQYFEVVEAGLTAGGVRYVLMPWRDEHTFRIFVAYDEASEAQRLADHAAASRQRKTSVAASFASIFLGHLPAHVQEKIGNDYGITPSRMTIMSSVPALVLLGTCAWFYVDSRLKQTASPIPIWLWIVAMGLFFDAVIRFQAAMGQNRGMGSLPGAILYTLFWYLTGKRFLSPFATERGGSTTFMIDPAEEIALQDALHVRAPLFTFLTPEEQRRLAERFGYDYRIHSYTPAVIILVIAGAGAIGSAHTLFTNGGLKPLASAVLATGLCIEQMLRLLAFNRGPAGSILGMVVRPFLGRFLGRG